MCSVATCNRDSYCRGYCRPHYNRWRKFDGDVKPDLPLPVRVTERRCTVKDCTSPDEKYEAAGFCTTHYGRKQTYGDPLGKAPAKPPKPLCAVDGCDRVAQGRGWCPMHYQRWVRYGDPNGMRATHGKKRIPRSVTSAGYVMLYRPDHPNARKGSGMVAEHTVVMSEIIGRALGPKENVHHKNGDRADNRRSNLELWDRSQPPGQRIPDKIRFALEILERYGSDPDAYS